MQEVLGSIIFLFVKHPYDVGDRVQINKEFYIVQEINLLSTVFMDSSSAYVQAPNNILNTLVSVRRMMSSAVHVKYCSGFKMFAGAKRYVMGVATCRRY
jgi:small-conductance mechanosensitive channel